MATAKETLPAGQEALWSCEAAIERSLEGAYSALRRIHDEKLYKFDGYGNFKDYCEKRWGYSKSYAHRLIDHSKIVDHLKSQGVEILPSGEGQTRALTKLRRKSKNEDDFLQKASHAWEVATDTAPRQFDVPKVTAAHVESAIGHFGIGNRKAKPKEPPDVTEIKNAVAKFSHCKALKLSGHEYVEKYGVASVPGRFKFVLDWMLEVAEIAPEVLVDAE